MQLYYSPSSPYARKVRMLAILLNVENLEFVVSNPMTDDALRRINPLGKVPALVDQEFTLLESSLICEYLHERYNKSGVSFLRRETPDYYPVQRVHALADGILDAALATVMELRRSEAERSSFWLDRWHTAIINVVQNIDTADLGDSEDVHIGTIAMAAALGYLDFRLPQLNWRQSNSALGQWYERLEQENWVTQTAPQDA